MIRENLAENLKQVQQNIFDACEQAGRNPSDVTLVAVSKTRPIADILDVLEAGQVDFAENRVEEAQIKIPEVNRQSEQSPVWHMIGHIQSRKVKTVVSLFEIIHSVDSVKLAAKLARQAQDVGKEITVFLEMNVSGEASKHGFQAFGWKNEKTVRDDLWESVREILKMDCLKVSGFMTMAPFVANPEDARPTFAELATLRDELAYSFQTEFPELSMGMTNDYPIAIEEGATIVRIGRAIFGEREA